MLNNPTPLPVFLSSKPGTLITQQDAAGNMADPVNGNSIVNNGITHLSMNNFAGTVDVTVKVFTTFKHDSDLAVSDRLYTIPAGTWMIAGPFDKTLFNNGDHLELIASSPLPIIPTSAS
jgi:hypothetical protein